MLQYADLALALEECSYRVAFVTDAFAQNPVNQTIELTYDGQMGLCLILDDIRRHITIAQTVAGDIYKGVAR